MINVPGEKAECYEKFQGLLGQEINRKESINYVKILTEKFKLADAISPATSTKFENFHKNIDKVKEVENYDEKSYFYFIRKRVQIPPSLILSLKNLLKQNVII